jgi:hypothetical protein
VFLQLRTVTANDSGVSYCAQALWSACSVMPDTILPTEMLIISRGSQVHQAFPGLTEHSGRLGCPQHHKGVPRTSELNSGPAGEEPQGSTGDPQESPQILPRKSVKGCLPVNKFYHPIYKTVWCYSELQIFSVEIQKSPPFENDSSLSKSQAME